MTPDEVLAALKRGNENFSKGLRTSRNYLNEQKTVALTMADIRKKSPVLAELESKGAIKIAGAMYNLDTALLTFLA